MKDYIIWLKSGESIYGTMDDEEINRLKGWLKSNQDYPGEFQDTDGELIFFAEQVAAIAINATHDTDSIGFNMAGCQKKEDELDAQMVDEV